MFAPGPARRVSGGCDARRTAVAGFVTPRLQASPLGECDIEFLHALWSDDRVAPTLGGARDRSVVETAVRQSAEHWARYGFGRWVLRSGEQRVGTVKLAHCRWTGRPEVEIGYAISPGCWGRGYATEAARGALAYARDHTGLLEIIAVVRGGNTRSTTVLKRLHFKPEARIQLAEGEHDVYRRAVR